MLMRLMSKFEYLIVPKGTKFTGSGKLGLKPTHCGKFKVGLATRECGSRSLEILSGFAKSRSYLDLCKIFYTACAVDLKITISEYVHVCTSNGHA